MNNGNYRPVTVGDWMITYLLLSIPIVNIILIFVWAFGSNTPISKSNWAKATLIWSLIGIVLSIAFYAVLFLIIGVGAANLHM